MLNSYKPGGSPEYFVRAGCTSISRPYLQILARADEKGLEIGTGSGYQAAVLAEMTDSVFSIEILPELAEQAQKRLLSLGYETVHVRTGNGYLGWPEEAPFDAIVVTAAPDEVPQPLVDQLAVHGRMVIPVGTRSQEAPPK